MVMSRKMEFYSSVLDSKKEVENDNGLHSFDQMEPSKEELAELERPNPKKKKSSISSASGQKSASTVHYLDRADKVCYGGFLRFSFYKETGGKKPSQIETDIPSLKEDGNLFKEHLTTNHIVFKDVYLKSDASNRELPEIVLALIEAFDFVVAFEDGSYDYGFVKIKEKPKTVEERMKSFAQRAKDLSQKLVSVDKPHVEQLTLF